MREGSPVGVLTFVGSIGFYCKEMWASDLIEGRQLGVLTFVGSMGFYCKEMWASDLIEGRPPVVSTFVDIMGFNSKEVLASGLRKGSLVWEVEFGLQIWKINLLNMDLRFCLEVDRKN